MTLKRRILLDAIHLNAPLISPRDSRSRPAHSGPIVADYLDGPKTAELAKKAPQATEIERQHVSF